MSNNYSETNGRPFYRRLPGENPDVYQGNTAVDWITNFWDELYVNVINKLDTLPKNFDPITCDEEWLDFLAVLCGFTPPYWDFDYSVESKRLLLAKSYELIWANKGTLESLSYILTSLNIEHKISQPGSFIIGQSLLNSDLLGQQGWQFKVTLPANYSPDGKKIKLAERIVELFSPAWCKKEVEIDQTVLLGIILLASDTNKLLNLANTTDLYVSNGVGTVNNTQGTFNNPEFYQEPVNLLLN